MAVPTAVTIPHRFAEAGVPFTFAAAPTTPTAIDWMPGDILIAFNSGGSPYTVTITSKPKSRRADMTITAESLAGGVYHVFPRFPPQDDDTLEVSASNDSILFARISTHAQPS